MVTIDLYSQAPWVGIEPGSLRCDERVTTTALTGQPCVLCISSFSSIKFFADLNVTNDILFECTWTWFVANIIPQWHIHRLYWLRWGKGKFSLNVSPLLQCNRGWSENYTKSRSNHIRLIINKEYTEAGKLCLRLIEKLERRFESKLKSQLFIFPSYTDCVLILRNQQRKSNLPDWVTSN